mgnify:CR=1 FL=1
MISVDDLKSVLNYDRETGLFTWAKHVSSNATFGKIAGTISSNGYRVITINKSLYKAHRLAYLYITGHHPTDFIDHINGIKDDNRWNNLRAATRSENGRNRRLNLNNKSGFIGVCWHKGLGMWQSNIRHDNKQIYLGVFKTPEEAAKKRDIASKKYGYHENHGSTF